MQPDCLILEHLMDESYFCALENKNDIDRLRRQKPDSISNYRRREDRMPQKKERGSSEDYMIQTGAQSLSREAKKCIRR